MTPVSVIKPDVCLQSLVSLGDVVILVVLERDKRVRNVNLMNKHDVTLQLPQLPDGACFVANHTNCISALHVTKTISSDATCEHLIDFPFNVFTAG